VTHQETGKAATSVPHRFSRDLPTDEEPYRRRVTATPEWVPLETGHISTAVQLVIRNLETDSEKVVRLGGGSGRTILIFPGESCRFQPDDLGDWLICCDSGTAKCNLVLIPG
jgi:hypothetical protein